MTITRERSAAEIYAPANGDAVAWAEHLGKVYGTSDAQVVALDDVTVEFGRGRLTAIMGPSGSGKSTLMHCMAALDAPRSGRVVIVGVDIHGLEDKRSGTVASTGDRLRRRTHRQPGALPAPALEQVISAVRELHMPMPRAGAARLGETADNQTGSKR
ncbi:MAG: ATP-binding cassette domain-containing protein [Dermatophilaceae bacterium]|nr:ATP-binding cassette domain-containing protein [Dermatophilaceae bacterium]